MKKGPIFTSIARGINLEAAGYTIQKEPEKVTELNVSESIVKGASALMHLEDEEDTLEKGVFSDTFEYLDKYSIPVRKLGKDVKSGLDRIMKYTESEKVKCMKSLESLMKKCTSKPSQSPSGYMTRGLEAKMDVVPKMFSYKDMELPKADSPTDMKKLQENRECMYAYNDEARKYLSLCIDYIYAETMKEGIIDDREYTFSVKQAAQL